MSKYNYSSIDDLRDVLSIYGGDWNISVWNPVDRKKMELGCARICEHFEPWFYLVKEDKSMNHIKKTRDFHQYLVGVPDKARFTAMNLREQQKMNIVFSGSDNTTHTVNFTAWYVDPKYHRWKLNMYMTWMKIKSKIKKIIKF